MRSRPLAEVTRTEELRHAETLLPAIDQCLEDASCALDDLDGLAVSLGPGSFTGLRVGLATAKGLALSTGAWLIGVPTLEAYARAASSAWVAAGEGPRAGDFIHVCLDARKSEVYTALFRPAAGVPSSELEVVLADAVESPERAWERVRSALQEDPSDSTTLRVVGEGAQRYGDELKLALGAFLGPGEVLDGPGGRGLAMAELGVRRFQRQGPDDPIYLAPVYLRESEAERKRREAS